MDEFTPRPSTITLLLFFSTIIQLRAYLEQVPFLRVANYAIQWLWSWQVLCAQVQIQGLCGELNEPEITEWWIEEG